MFLSNDNYFVTDMLMQYMSTSQFKAFEDCEARAMAELRGDYISDKAAYKEGHYFEACITANEKSFIEQNPDMVSSRGATKGEIKSNFKKIIGSAAAFKRQNIFMDIVKKCEQQVIVTGQIANVSFKGMIDFFDVDTLAGYDTKCVANFKKIWSNADKMYINWYFAYGYHYQAAIYRELIRQQFGKVGRQHLLAVTKEEIPDVASFYFSDEILDNALEIIKEFTPHFDKLKNGLATPVACGVCDYCKQNKIITDFEMIGEYE